MFEWLNEWSEQFLQRGYLEQGVTPQERVWDIAQTAESYLGKEGFAEKFYEYMGRGYFSLSSPVWSNYGNSRGLPVSCFGSYVGDSVAEILETHAEVGMMSKLGGGTSAYFGDVRPRGASISHNRGESTGAVSFMEIFDTLTGVVSQGSVRRGRFTPYLPITHPDFDEFICIGTDEHSIQGLTHGVIVDDAFMNQMIQGNEEYRRRWAKVIETRSQVGFPYIFFKDTVNNGKPQAYKDKNYEILASNLCSEIALPSSKDESFVCVLSSMNLLHYDEWKDTDAVEVLTMFLDTVVTDFLDSLYNMAVTDPVAQIFMQRAEEFALQHRALGIGTLGFHSYLQSNMIPFESQEAAKLNLEMHKHIQSAAHMTSKNMGSWYGEAPVMEGYGYRNSTLTSIAPTKSSSFILGQVSASIEPEMSNYHLKDLAKVKKLHKNPYLEDLLARGRLNEQWVWDSIAEHDGSVQHLDFLSYDQKEVFKTFGELNQESIINMAAVRQNYIDQSQSLNLMIGPQATAKEINKLMIHAWKMGIKSLYYQYSTSAAQEMARNLNCVACES